MRLPEWFRARRERFVQKYLANVEEFVAPTLDDGEGIVAVSGGAPQPPFRPIRGKCVVVTDRRFLVVGMSWSDRPATVESHRREAVTVIDHRDGYWFLHVAFRIDGSSLDLYVKPWFRSRMEAVVAALPGHAPTPE